MVERWIANGKLSEMLAKPLETAKIVQYDLMRADAPLPTDTIFGALRHRRIAALVVGSEETAARLSASELLEAARRHPCCFSRSLASLSDAELQARASRWIRESAV